MPPRRAVGPQELRAAVAAVEPWLNATGTTDATEATGATSATGAGVTGATGATGLTDAVTPPRPQLAAAVRLTLRTLAQVAPGGSVEVRVPPYGVVQCVEGPRHTRGTPSNVVQADPRTWLLLATGRLSWTAAVHGGAVTASGTRAAEIAAWLPLVGPGRADQPAM